MSGAGDPPARASRSAGHRARKGRPFVLSVRSLRSRPGSRLEVHLVGPIPDMSVSDAEVPEGADVSFDGWIESTLGGVTVAGHVSAPWSGVCRRCLEVASGTLRAEVREPAWTPSMRVATCSGQVGTTQTRTSSGQTSSTLSPWSATPVSLSCRWRRCAMRVVSGCARHAAATATEMSAPASSRPTRDGRRSLPSARRKRSNPSNPSNPD